MTRIDILNKLKAGSVSVEEAAKLLTVFDPPRPSNQLSFRVSRKGAISLYGLQIMPVTLYVEQWERLYAASNEFKAFVKKWEGKEYKGESALEKGGKKVPYTATIVRKAA